MAVILGCKHEQFKVECHVDRKEVPFPSSVTIRFVLCTQCGRPFQFIGLPCGPVQVSPDRYQATLQIIPKEG